MSQQYNKKIKTSSTLFILTLCMVLFTDFSFVVAEMCVVSDSELEATIGEGVQISFTGQIGVSVSDNASISLGTGSNPTGYLTLSNISESETNITPLEVDGKIAPMQVSVKESVDDSDPCIENGTGYIEVGLPSVKLSTGAFSALIGTDNDSSASNGIDEFCGLSFTTGFYKINGGTVKIFAN